MSRRGDEPAEREVEPDLAALDELMRAFDIEVGDEVRPAIDDRPGAGSADDEIIRIGDDLDEWADPVYLDDLDDLEDDRDHHLDDHDLDDDHDHDHGRDHHRDHDDDAAPVITIADDELPDAVYVEGDLGGPGKRSRRQDLVFIDDAGAADQESISDETPARIEPRLRDRRDAVRRAADRKRNRWLALVGLVAVVAVAALAVLGSPLFAVTEDRLVVTGAVYTDPVRLQAVVDDLVGTPTLIADTRSLELELEAIPWVDTARVRTSFPRSASIEIRERSALATFQGPDGRFRVIDREGRVLDVIDGQPIAYMLVTGPDATDLEAGAFAPVGYAAAAELVQALTPSVRGRVAAVDVTGDGSQLRLLLDDGVEVRFGAADELLVKLVRLESVIETALADGVRIIDVSTAEVTTQ